MSAKYHIFKDGDMWSAMYPSGSTVSLPTWRDIMEHVATVQRRAYIDGWLKRASYAAGQPGRQRPRTVDVLYTERIHLLRTDPEKYFREYPRVRYSWEQL